MIKRYNLIIEDSCTVYDDYGNSKWQIEEEESKDGIWCKWNDVRKEIASLQKKLKSLQEAHDYLEDNNKNWSMDNLALHKRVQKLEGLNEELMGARTSCVQERAKLRKKVQEVLNDEMFKKEV